MAIQVAERVKKIPPYLFSTIDELKEKVKKRGNTLIDLGMGNPDLPTPPHIVERLREAAMDSSTHRYSSARGDEELRKAIADWYERRYGVYLDFQEEVLPLIGSKEGIAVTYLTFINGDQPKPNACGLNPKNDPNEWTGWGGPLDADNMTIGEGPGTRNDIVIGGVYFERGIGTHADAKFVYDLTGGNYVKFEGYVGMSDEKDPDECGHGGSSIFIFSVDGKEMFKSDLLTGCTEDGENVAPVKVEFDIPAGAKELTIQIDPGDDGKGCDHACLGDAKLLTSEAVTAVNPCDKLSTLWGKIKSAH